MKLRKKQQKKGDCMTDGHKKAGDPWSFLACCESINNGDFSSYRPIPCREEQQQNLIQNASMPANWLGKEVNQQRRADGASGSGTGEERRGEKRARGDGVSEEQATGLTNPSSPLRYTVGVADRLCSASPLLCLSENIQNGNLTPLLKIAEFTRFQLEVPLLKCDNGEQIPRLISKRQHVKPGEKSPAELLGSLHRALCKSQRQGKATAEKPPPTSGAGRPPALPAPRCPLPGRLPPAGEPPRRAALPACRRAFRPRSPRLHPRSPPSLPPSPSQPRGAARRPQLQEPAPLSTLRCSRPTASPSSGGAPVSNVPRPALAAAHASSAPLALNPSPPPSGGRRDA